MLKILFSIGSNRLVVEQLGYNILYRWFLGLSLEDAIWDHLEELLLSKDHFSVDGTQIDA